MKDPKNFSRRGVIKAGAAVGAAASAPFIFTRNAFAYTNEPKGANVTFGFNVPQTGAYADEGADELRAYELAVEHINGEGDGGMLSTFSSKELKGDGINGKKVVVRHRRHPDQVRRRTRVGQAHDREGRRDHDHRRLVVRCRGGGAGLLPGSRRHLHGRPHPLQRHHRQGQARQRFPSLLQHRDVGRRARARC